MKTPLQKSNGKDQYLAPKEAASILKINVKTIYNWATIPQTKGGPPVRKFGRKLIRFPRQDFFDWIDTKSPTT